MNKGFTVESAPHFITSEGLRKLDLVASLGQTSVVVDAQVVGDQVDLKTADSKKTEYYSKNESLTNQIKTKYNTSNVLTHSA